MKEHLVITLRVFDKYYRLKINRKDEQKFRDAVVTIEKKTNQYRNYFLSSGVDNLEPTDYLAMTSIQALSETEELEADNKMFEDKITKLINEVDNYLKQTK